MISRGIDGTGRLKKAVLVDVDGTLAGEYRKGKRKLRPSAVAAIKFLAANAPVYLWSVAGAENAERLIEEFPKLSPYIAGCYGKGEFPLGLVDHPYCIDDEAIDKEVLECNYVVLNETYDGGKDSGLLLKAARAIVEHMSKSGGKPCTAQVPPARQRGSRQRP
jgi:hypothetical protein